MGFLKEFKEFALKGNMMDMAVGVIIGGAFGKIVSSLVNDIIMPPIGALLGNTNFRDLKIDISSVKEVATTVQNSVSDGISQIAALDSTAVTNVLSSAPAEATSEPVYWCYGAFIQECVDFFILAFCVFLIIKLMNSIMKKKKAAEEAPAAPAEPSNEEKLLEEIRDLLKNQSK